MYYFIVYVNSSKIALLSAPRFSGKAAAKVRTFSVIFQIFSKVFSIFLRKWSPARRRPLSENGCKGKDFFCYLPNFTESFFDFFRRVSQRPATRAGRVTAGKTIRKCLITSVSAVQASPLPSRKRVQKYTLYTEWQNIYPSFFELLSKFL